MTSWLSDWTQEGKHLSKEGVPLRKSESKARDQVTPELRDRDIPAALKTLESSAASSVWTGSGSFFQISFRWKTQGWVPEVYRMFKVRKRQEWREVQEGPELRNQGPGRVKD